MWNNITRYYVELLLLILLIMGVHQLVLSFSEISVLDYFSFSELYGFLFLLFAAIMGMIFIVYYISPEFGGYSYLLSILLKMVAVVWFLYPLLKSDLANKKLNVLLFMLLFFILLVHQVFAVLRLINQGIRKA